MLGLTQILPAGNEQAIPICGIMVGIVGWITVSAQHLMATKRYEEAASWIRQMPLWLVRVLYSTSAILMVIAIAWRPGAFWLSALALVLFAISVSAVSA